MPLRFNIPFFSFRSPSRPSSGTSSPSPPPTPTPSRPPFRPGGIAQPSKPATSLETKPKVSPSLSRAKSNVSATAASSSASQLPSRGAATPTRLAKQSNQSGSPVKKPESLRAEEQKAAMKDKPSREVRKEAGENSNTVVEKPRAARSEQKEAKEAPEQRRREVALLAVVERDSKTAQKSKETEKLAVEEKKKGLQKDMEEKTAQEQQKSKETEKLAVEEKKKGLRKDIEEKTKRAQETEKLAVEEKKKVLQNDMKENSKTAQEQQRNKETKQKRDETEKLAAEEKKKVLSKDTEDNSKAGQEQHKIKETEKLATEEIHTALKTVGTEDATQSKTTPRITAENHTNGNNQKAKEGSSSMGRKIKEDIRDGLSKLTWGKSNGDEKSVSVFTLTGENRGANMAIGSEKDKKDGEVHIRRGYKSNPDESPETTATETEGGTRPFNDKNPKDDKEDASVRAYVNGNSQGVNNSIICDSSVQQNDPGIHMNLKFEKAKKKDETISPPESVVEKKPATEKMKYEPRVRRRCLRGLLAESSQSEPENPSKPRRHGCRFTCKDKDIENT
ncbi:hypothetical protein Bca4012_057914 [Brassica carinata]|uniref:Uncharacterized protein n=1 Tax=Brassica carinata TaxID=52824 RepID=A0A8X7P4Y2_BRACI|nr:hypothetical protein Bca52824_094133 [Brassica carinata]